MPLGDNAYVYFPKLVSMTSLDDIDSSYQTRYYLNMEKVHGEVLDQMHRKELIINHLPKLFEVYNDLENRGICHNDLFVIIGDENDILKELGIVPPDAAPLGTRQERVDAFKKLFTPDGTDIFTRWFEREANNENIMVTNVDGKIIFNIIDWDYASSTRGITIDGNELFAPVFAKMIGMREIRHLRQFPGYADTQMGGYKKKRKLKSKRRASRSRSKLSRSKLSKKKRLKKSKKKRKKTRRRRR